VLDRCRELGTPVAPFVASARAARPDRFLNLRAEAWWAAREAFRRGDLDLDPDDRVLAAQLAGVRYGIASNGAIQIGDKAKMRDSPDRADALVIAAWARQQQERNERMAEQAKAATRAMARPRPHVPTEVAMSGQATTEELLSGAGRRPWREVIDDDLPEFR
jgi:hypothetical protein